MTIVRMDSGIDKRKIQKASVCCRCRENRSVPDRGEEWSVRVFKFIVADHACTNISNNGIAVNASLFFPFVNNAGTMKRRKKMMFWNMVRRKTRKTWKKTIEKARNVMRRCEITWRELAANRKEKTQQ